MLSMATLDHNPYVIANTNSSCPYMYNLANHQPRNFSVMIVVTVLLALAISALKRDRRSTDRLWTYGLGSVDSQNLLIGAAPENLTSVIVLANCPQLIFSFLYLMLSAVFTTMLVAREWSQYSSHRKALRVSVPTGMQRSTFFLSIPYKYGVPLMAVSTLLQWLVSQAMFLVRTTGHDHDGFTHPAWDESKVGFSHMGVVLAFVLFVFLVVVFLVLGLLKKYPAGEQAMPLASTCSAAISAACHRPKEDEDAHLLPVQWGVVSRAGEPLVCAFTTAGDVRPPPQDSQTA